MWRLTAEAFSRPLGIELFFVDVVFHAMSCYVMRFNARTGESLGHSKKNDAR